MPDENAVARARQSFDGVLGALRDGRALYYQDRNRRWPFHTRARGHALLTELLDAAARLVAVSDVELERLGAERAAAVQREGASIYARKPNKRQEDVTWSQAEYAHAGLQREYCRFKSVQRFTETYALLERAHDAGVFRELRDAAPAEGRLAVRVASLGGGPGFELLAFRSFFARLFPHVDAEYISLDLAEEWGPYATRVGGEEAEACASAAGAGGGVRFGVWDVRDGAGLHKAAGGPIDYAIISYVLHHYMCNRECAHWLGQWLNSPAPEPLRARTLDALPTAPSALGDAPAPRALFISSRYEQLGAELGLLGAEGVEALRLIEQGAGRDDRQLVLRARGAPSPTPLGIAEGRISTDGAPSAAAADDDADDGAGGGGGGGGGGYGDGDADGYTFPNVPYEEHKRKQHGGKRGAPADGARAGEAHGRSHQRARADDAAPSAAAASARPELPPPMARPPPEELARQRAARLQAARDRQAALLAQRQAEDAAGAPTPQP